MISYDQALSSIISEVDPYEAVKVSLLEAVGQVCAETILSTVANPAFRNSAMDGFAIRSAETEAASTENPLQLKVIKTLEAGKGTLSELNPAAGEVIAIMTGAEVPGCYDAVIPVEHTEKLNDDSEQILIKRQVKPNENIREAGEDYFSGTELLTTGDLIRSEHTLLLAANGYSELSVVKPPRIAVLSTGSELVSIFAEQPQKLEAGEIYNSTAPFLLSVFSQLGADVTYYGTVSDDPEEFHSIFNELLSDQPDLVVTTGAVSMGTKDFIPQAFRDAGGEIVFHKAGVRPGKPVLFGKISREDKKTLFFGLPGNPLSVVVGTRFFVLPALRAAAGRAAEKPLRVKLKNDVKKPEKLKRFCLGRVTHSESGSEIFVEEKQQSFRLLPAAHNNSWAILPEGKDFLEAGELVDCVPFFP